jgi:hypothetical protein
VYLPYKFRVKENAPKALPTQYKEQSKNAKEKGPTIIHRRAAAAG